MSFVCDAHEFSFRINDEASICTAELLAIEAAIEYKSQKLNNPIVSNILHMCHYLSGHKDIVFAGYWNTGQKTVLIYTTYTIILISSTTSLSTLMTFCKVNGTSMSPANCSRYNQSLSDTLHQWNAEKMTLSYAGIGLAMPISQADI